MADHNPEKSEAPKNMAAGRSAENANSEDRKLGNGKIFEEDEFAKRIADWKLYIEENEPKRSKNNASMGDDLLNAPVMESTGVMNNLSDSALVAEKKATECIVANEKDGDAILSPSNFYKQAGHLHEEFNGLSKKSLERKSIESKLFVPNEIKNLELKKFASDTNGVPSRENIDGTRMPSCTKDIAATSDLNLTLRDSNSKGKSMQDSSIKGKLVQDSSIKGKSIQDNITTTRGINTEQVENDLIVHLETKIGILKSQLENSRNENERKQMRITELEQDVMMLLAGSKNKTSSGGVIFNLISRGEEILGELRRNRPEAPSLREMKKLKLENANLQNVISELVFKIQEREDGRKCDLE